MAIFRPEIYHGFRKKERFFEGWYFKFVSKDRQKALAVIPGVSINNGNSSHAFIQLIANDNFTRYIRFDFSEFYASKKELNLKIQGNSFSQNYVKLEIKSPDVTLWGEISFSNQNPWPVTILSPGAMGWYSYMPFMECYHGVLSMDHDLKGKLYLNSKELNFDGGKGYIEKDWGKSFPSAWIWLQSNCFEIDRTSIMVSVATIPWIGKSFTGFIVGFLYSGKLYRFTTYNRSELSRLEISENNVMLEFRRKDLKLEIEAYRTDGGELRSPIMGSMEGRINETLSALIKVTLSKNGKKLFQGTGTNSGLEVVGKLKR
ncbi:tocopherol cyclase family protein [Kosmotoga arenicorallina]|uniref:tocopherol cyclase family protein n=1 Tax=Kosmotoga arenicorallina TaxID=688066 RepID=UPI00082DBB94|nr:tocopherol cyclase family protein [Kosmotoga arenicorallina]